MSELEGVLGPPGRAGLEPTKRPGPTRIKLEKWDLHFSLLIIMLKYA